MEPAMHGRGYCFTFLIIVLGSINSRARMGQNIMVVGAYGRGSWLHTEQEAVRERPKGTCDKIQQKGTCPMNYFHQIAPFPVLSRISGTALPLEDWPLHQEAFADNSYSSHNGGFSKHKHTCRDGQGWFLGSPSDCFLWSLLNNTTDVKTPYFNAM